MPAGSDIGRSPAGHAVTRRRFVTTADVLHDHIWRAGWLNGWNKLDGRWRAYVDWFEGPGPGLEHRT